MQNKAAFAAGPYCWPCGAFRRPENVSRNRSVWSPALPRGAAPISYPHDSAEARRAPGTTVIVENRTGGAPISRRIFGARAAPDGYTLFVGGSATNGEHDALQEAGYDILRDCADLATHRGAEHSRAAPERAGALAPGIVALARKNPGHLNYASAGNASSNHFSGALLTSMAKSNWCTFLQGRCRAIIDTIAGHVSMYSAPSIPALPHIRTGKGAGLPSRPRSARRRRRNSDVLRIGLPGLRDGRVAHGCSRRRARPTKSSRAQYGVVRGLSQPDAKQRLGTQGFDVIGTRRGARRVHESGYRALGESHQDRTCGWIEADPFALRVARAKSRRTTVGILDNRLRMPS